MKYLFFGLGMIPALFAVMYVGGIVRAVFTNANFTDRTARNVHVFMGAFTSAVAIWIFSVAVSV